MDAGARARWLAVALEGKPGQRHRQSASLTKGRGGIGGVGRESRRIGVSECSACDRVHAFRQG